ncbi:putative adipose-regulatory protein-domain-containing protein [Pseudomassariella vexata]|uniref:Putative adipose-regulatory protein-domain-containing protein n=1 Tax=Pseudomassariella vexata TaxID=1141098 RepID=A0A1Y2DTS0_9PEZI|nr:putative adipose-regulatory protein-domain-containing protein [Pseudomassariella vexata]ORY62647.1 putative adipose-regulatory protein-domain-containing protein [Pseudomassariella vexata]
MEYVKRPIRVATAPSAQRAYLTTFFLVATSLTLLGIATLAYPVFYYSYVPKKVVSVPVHLQYNAGVNPYGLTSVSKDLMLETSYDVAVELILPRSPPNLDRGNFMVALFAMKSAPNNPAHLWAVPDDPYKHVNADSVIFSSRRPALIPYADPLVSASSRLLFLPYHIFVPESEQATLTIPMGELVEFRDQLPLSMLLDVQAGQSLQVYSARIELVARLRGIRWAMYNHRIISFFVCTACFWIAEMTSMGFAWLLLSYCLSGRGKTKAAVQQNTNAGAGDGSDHTAAAVRREAEVTGGGKPEVKREAGEDVTGKARIKEESVERNTRALDSPRRTSDADNEESAGVRDLSAYNHDENRGLLRRRLSQKSIS